MGKYENNNVFDSVTIIYIITYQMIYCIEAMQDAVVLQDK